MNKNINNSIKTILEQLKTQEEIEEEFNLILEIKIKDVDEDERLEHWINRLKYIKNMYKIGMVSKAYYYYNINYIIGDIIFERKVQNGDYDSILNPISKKMREIERNAGLKEDEYWPIKHGPPEWKKLNKEFEKLFEIERDKLICDLDFADVIEYKNKNKKKFIRIIEEGRKEIFDNEYSLNIDTLLQQYKTEFEKCRKMQSYYSAIVMAGTILETYLIKICLLNEKEISKTIDKKNSNKRKKITKNPIDWNLSTLLIVCEEAELIPLIELDDDALVSIY